MKKIMKKALSLALALVMMFTLAPMTAFAAAGDDIANNLFNVCDDIVEVEANETAYFEMGDYPPGEYPLIVEGTGDFTVTPCGLGEDTWYSEGSASVAATDGTVTTVIEIQENAWGGFAITNNSDAKVTYMCTVEVPQGTMNNPEMITLSPMGPTTVTVPAGAEYYFASRLPEIGKEIGIKITGEEGFAYYTGMGMPIRDMYGVVEATIMQRSMQPAQFAIINGTQQAQTYSIELFMLATGTESNPDQMAFGDEIVAELEGNEYWYSCEFVDVNGNVTITVDEDACANGWTIMTINEYTGDVIIKSSADGNEPVFEAAVESYSPFYIVVSVPENNGAGTVAFTTEFEEVVVEYPLGSSENKDELVIDETTTVEIVEEYSMYYYSFTSVVGGKLSIEALTNGCPAGWVISISTDTSDDWSRDIWMESNYATDAEEEGTDFVNPVTFITEEGETVTVVVCTGDWKPGTVQFKATFEEGVSGSTTPDEEEEEVNYEMSDATFVVGEMNELPLSFYEYTIFVFEPTETGVYTFTSEDSLMGVASNNGMWVVTEPSATTVTEETITWNCTGVGQTIWISVIGETNVANIELTREDIVEESYETDIVDVSAPTYVFTGNVADLVYVDVEDATVDKAVYSEKDGYYHLNSVDGPILLVNLDEELMSFVVTNPSLPTPSVAITYKEGDKIVLVKDYSEAVQKYVGSSDPSTKLYPLTNALITVYQTFGAQQKWYDGEAGFVSGQFGTFNAEDIWMFACMYVPNAEDGTIVVPPVVVAPEQVENKVVKEDVLDEIIESAIENNKPVVVPTTTPGVTMTFDVADLENATSVDLNVEVTVVDDADDETVAENENIEAEKFVLKVEFTHEGKLPAKATITITVPAAVIEEMELAEGDKLYYHKILADGTLEFICESVLDENGNVKVTQDSCSDYVLLTEKVSDDVVVPGTGDSTSVALWIAVLALGLAAIAGSVVMRKREF